MSNENPPFELQTPAKRAKLVLAPVADTSNHVAIRITRLGHGEVSQGRHDGETGDAKFAAGDIARVPPEVADALEARGFAEIQ